MKTNRDFNEHESLALISQMIQQTKNNLRVGNGNEFLVYGYAAFAIGMIIYVSQLFGLPPAIQNLWFLMFVPMLIVHFKGTKAGVVSYTDRAVQGVWQIVGYMHLLSVVIIVVQFYLLDVGMGTIRSLIQHLPLIMPLSIFYISMGVGITGILLKEKSFQLFLFIGLTIGISLLLTLDFLSMHCSGIYALASIFILIIPGHMLNTKKERG